MGMKPEFCIFHMYLSICDNTCDDMFHITCTVYDLLVSKVEVLAVAIHFSTPF